MKTLAALNVRIGTNIKGFEAGMKKTTRRLKKLQRDTGRIGSAIQNNITLPLLAVGAASAKLFLDVGQNFNKIENLVGVTGEGLQTLKDGVKDLSEEVGVSQAKLSDALFVVTSAGLDVAEAMEVLAEASKASAVGLGDTTEIARASTAVLNAYGKENISAAEATNVLFNTVKEGNLSAESLAPTLGPSPLTGSTI